jgi:hypothetical protein
MTRAEAYREHAAELLSQAKELTEQARRYLRLADAAAAEAGRLVDSGAAPIAPELEEFEFLSFITGPEPRTPVGTRPWEKSSEPQGVKGTGNSLPDRNNRRAHFLLQCKATSQSRLG